MITARYFFSSDFCTCIFSAFLPCWTCSNSFRTEVFQKCRFDEEAAIIDVHLQIEHVAMEFLEKCRVLIVREDDMLIDAVGSTKNHAKHTAIISYYDETYNLILLNRQYDTGRIEKWVGQDMITITKHRRKLKYIYCFLLILCFSFISMYLFFKVAK